jgi:endonuclease/exonuclease/phosphatase family metal-dependent hydrolase
MIDPAALPLSARRSDGLRVVTLNLFGRRASWDERRQVIRDCLLQLSPDLVGFQEAIKNDDYDQVVDLLGPDFHVVHQTTREAGDGTDVEPGQGVSVASRWPLRNVRELDLHVTPRTTDFACGAIVADVLAPAPIGPMLLAYHNPSWKLQLEYERELQAIITARFVEEVVGDRDPHVVMFGDLDADPQAASARFWTGRQSLGGMSVCYRDAWESTHADDPGHTFTPRNAIHRDRDWPFRRIDYLFVRCGEHGGPTLDVAACELLFDEPVCGIWASDHFGLVADLAVPKQNLREPG